MAKKKAITLSEKQQQAIQDWCLNTEQANSILESLEDEFPCEDEDFDAWGKAIESHIMSLVNRLEYPSNE